MLFTLTKKFTDTMGRYQDCQAKYKERCQATVERQYRIGAFTPCSGNPLFEYTRPAGAA
jgi:hypothetical protein